MPLEEDDSEPGPQRWNIQKLGARQKGPDRVLEQSLHTMSVLQKLKSIGMTAIIKAPERTRFTVEVKNEQGEVVERLEGARLRVKRDAKQVFLLEVLPPESPMNETKPELKLGETVTDQPLLPKKKNVNELSPEARKDIMSEYAVRGGISAAVYDGREWAGKLAAMLLVRMKKLDVQKKIIEQLDAFNKDLSVSLRGMIRQVLESVPQDKGQYDYQKSIHDFCGTLATGSGPAVAWAKQLLIDIGPLEKVNEGAKQVGVAAGKLPSAVKAMELLKGRASQIGEGLAMLERLSAIHRYVDLVAGNPRELEALKNAQEVIKASQTKGGGTGKMDADVRKIRVIIGDKGIGKANQTIRDLSEIQRKAEERIKKPPQ